MLELSSSAVLRPLVYPVRTLNYYTLYNLEPMTNILPYYTYWTEFEYDCSIRVFDRKVCSIRVVKRHLGIYVGLKRIYRIFEFVFDSTSFEGIIEFETSKLQ